MSEICKELDSVLSKYIRPLTYPVAVKFLEQGEELPPKTRIPTRDFGYAIALCQGMTAARKLGWSMAFYKQDEACALGQVICGYVEEPDFIKDGSVVKPLYVGTDEAAARTQASTPKPPAADTVGILLVPLHLALFNPDIVVVYGNPAQITRLVQGALYNTGGYIESRFAGRGACGGELIVPRMKGECNVVCPGGGERVFALTADDEMAFAIPSCQIQNVMEGVEATHKGGVARIPTPVAGVTAKPIFPKTYRDLEIYAGLRGQE